MFSYATSLALFIGTGIAAIHFNWRPNELCWGLWISSLSTGWAVIVFSVLRLIAHYTGTYRLPDDLLIDKKEGRKHLPGGPIAGSVGSLFLGGFVALHFTFFHFAHGAFLSLFLPPAQLLNKNGYINSDFRQIVSQLMIAYWPVILATLVARQKQLLSGSPMQNMQSIYGTVVKIHIFIFLVFGIGMATVALGIQNMYERALTLALLFLFFFPDLKSKPDKKNQKISDDSSASRDAA